MSYSNSQIKKAFEKVALSPVVKGQGAAATLPFFMDDPSYFIPALQTAVATPDLYKRIMMDAKKVQSLRKVGISPKEIADAYTHASGSAKKYLSLLTIPLLTYLYIKGKKGPVEATKARNHPSNFPKKQPRILLPPGIRGE